MVFIYPKFTAPLQKDDPTRPAQTTLATPVDHDGDLDASLEALQSQMGTVSFGNRSLKPITLEVLRDQHPVII